MNNTECKLASDHCVESDATAKDLYFSMPLENGQLELSIPLNAEGELSAEDAKDTVTLLQTVMKRMKREIARHGAGDAEVT